MKRTRLAWGIIDASAARFSAALVLSLATVSCSGRDEQWTGATRGDTYGLTGSVALVDRSLDRLLMVTAPTDNRVDVRALPLGRNVTSILPSADRSRLFVLSEGAGDPTSPDSEGPRLTVVDGGTSPSVENTFLLDDPLKKLTIDPLGEWVVAYEASAVVTNLNELVICSLETGEATPKTIRSFGGAPKELIFTSELNLPRGGARRFLVVRTDRDVALIDLANLKRDEVTVQLPKTAAGDSTVPAQIVYDDGEADDDTDARLAVRLEGQSDVVLLELGQPSGKGDFSTTINIVDVGGVPSAIDFVRTDGGLRLAALVPTQRRATLVDPRTTTTEVVPFSTGYSQMRRITDGVTDAPENGDVALLYSPEQAGFAFWSLGQTSGTPFRSVEANDIDFAVTNVSDVPGDNRHLKLLSSQNKSQESEPRIYVLDLEERQTFPLEVSSQDFRLVVAQDGGRAWAFSPWNNRFASIDLESLHPTSLQVSAQVSAIHDIQRADGGRAALVFHGTEASSETGDPGVTLLDALNPISAKSRFFGGLFLEGLR